MVLAGIECSQKSLIFANGIPAGERVDFSTRSKDGVAVLLYPPVAQLDNAADSDSEERGFESLRAGHNDKVALQKCDLIFCSTKPNGFEQGVKKQSGGLFFSRGNERSEAIGTAVPRQNPFGRAITRRYEPCIRLKTYLHL